MNPFEFQLSSRWWSVSFRCWGRWFIVSIGEISSCDDLILDSRYEPFCLSKQVSRAEFGKSRFHHRVHSIHHKANESFRIPAQKQRVACWPPVQGPLVHRKHWGDQQVNL
ncbi:unnamed protein product [Acanthoscelides obtectus]|uniref:Uncharacterized protein n=1 Tax=Acanthoscelides obtectus TaxID=200917 RepID=A0A9P0VUQ2_ACAOB|nr:unnamed protein product [Acanthoscelides obtectus]CAK1689373.1 hypothetical protein AOBTE_LOCUS37201 [Acanthoscelides obtectus]